MKKEKIQGKAKSKRKRNGRREAERVITKTTKKKGNNSQKEGKTRRKTLKIKVQ